MYIYFSGGSHNGRFENHQCKVADTYSLSWRSSDGALLREQYSRTRKKKPHKGRMATVYEYSGTEYTFINPAAKEDPFNLSRDI